MFYQIRPLRCATRPVQVLGTSVCPRNLLEMPGFSKNVDRPRKRRNDARERSHMGAGINRKKVFYLTRMTTAQSVSSRQQQSARLTWRPHGDSNPGTYRERVVSWASRRWGPGKFLSQCWWRYAGSNRGPLACHASALPAELYPLERSSDYRVPTYPCKL